MTYRYLTLYCKNPKQVSSNRHFNRDQLRSFVGKNFYIDHLTRNENLEDDFIQMLSACDVDLSEEQRNDILNAPKTNTSARKHGLSYYYDEETADLVKEREWLLIERYGYKPPKGTRGV